MKKSIILLILALFLSSNLLSQETTWKTYTTDVYQVKYPADWTLNESESESEMMDFMALSPLESSKDKLRENINVVKETHSDLDLDGYKDASMKMLKLLFPKMKVHSQEKFMLNGNEVIKLTYTAKFEKNHLHFTQCYGIVGDKVYILTFTSEKKKYKKYQSTEDAIIDSFDLD